MTRIFLILLFIGFTWGQDECTADYGTEGIELWGVWYSIENTTEKNLYNNQLTGSIPAEIGNLTNLIELVLEDNQLTEAISESICNLNIELELNHNQLCPPYPECIEEFVGNQDTSNCSSVSIIEDVIPLTYALYNAYPNPFNPVTSLRYDLPNDGSVNITIYDMMGRVVKTLVNSSQTVGFKSIQWNATNDRNEPVTAGLYLYAIQAGEFRQIKKMVFLK